MIIAALCRAAPSLPSKSRAPRSWLLGAGFLVLSLVTSALGADSAAMRFDLPAGDAEKSLQAFHVQSGVQVLFSSHAAQGVRTNPVKGDFTARQALERLLDRTSLVGRLSEKSGAFVVSRRLAQEPPANAERGTVKKNRTVPPSNQEPMKKNSIFTKIAATAALLVGPASIAQTAPSGIGNSSSTASATVQLSPFVVNSSGDVGYVAQESLSGSRMKTSLKDVSAPVTVFTSEFLSDVSVTNLEGLLQYAPNVAIEGQETAAEATGNDEYIMTFTYRIRGLPSGGKARNYFKWALDSDMFNVERIDFSRGPNSILFGLGSPAGLLNVSTKTANFGDNKGSASLRYSDYSALRATVDYNHVLIADTLAVRLNLLAEKGDTWRDHEFMDQNRAHLAATWRIAPKTTLRGEYERGAVEKFSARKWLGRDLDQPWRDLGRPTFDNFVGGTGAIVTPGVADNVFGSARPPWRELATATGGYVVFNTDSGQLFNMRQMAETNFTASSDQLLPGELPIALSAVPLSPHQGQDIDVSTYTLFLEQQFFDKLFLELAFNKQDSTYSSIDAEYTEMGYIGDPNNQLPNRTPNPNAGQYYAEGWLKWRDDRRESEDMRATLSYELDLTEKSRWFGRHRFAGLAQETKERQAIEQYGEFLTNGVLLTGTNITNAANRVYRRNYLSTSGPGGTNPVFGGAPRWNALDDFQLLDGVTMTDHLGNSKVTDSALFSTGGAITTENLKSLMFVMQNYWFKDRLVTTYGYRTDRRVFETGGSMRRTPQGPSALYAQGDLVSLEPDGSNPIRAEGLTRTYGAVGHVFPWLRLFYNQSTNFSPANTAIRVFPEFKTAPNPTGEGKDYGIRMDLLDNKVSLSVTMYETSAQEDSAFSGRYFEQRAILILDELALRGDITPAQRNDLNVTNTNGYIFDSVSEGVEVELTANPTRNWRVSLTGTKNDTVRTNIAPGNYAFFDSMEELYTSGDRLRYLYGGTSLTPAVPITVESTIPNSIGRSWAEIKNRQAELFGSVEGLTPRGMIEHEVKFFNNYRFSEGPLKGLSVGGGLQWKDRSLAGYTTDDPATSERIWGGKYVNVDFTLGYGRRLTPKIDWRLQLNVKNLMDNDDIYITQKNQDGSTRSYRLRDPREFVLTNTFFF